MCETLEKYGLTREDLVHLVEGPWRRLKAVIEKKVIDCHAHNWKTTELKYVRSMRERFKVLQRAEVVDNTEEVIFLMDVHGVDKACVNFPGKLHKAREQVSYDDWLKSLAPYPDRLIEYVSAPWESAQFVRERLRQGAKMIEGEGRLPIGPNTDVKAVAPIMEAVEEFDVPVHLNTTSTSKAFKAYRQPELYLPYLTAYPEVKFLIGDAGGKRFPMGGGWQAIMIASMFENVYLEISGAPISIIEMAVRTLGVDRLVFGSCQGISEIRYFEPLGQWDTYLRWSTLNAVALADLSEAQRDMILYKNARRLLKLNKKDVTNAASR